MKIKLLLISLMLLTLTSCGAKSKENTNNSFNISNWETKLIDKNIKQVSSIEKSYSYFKKLTFDSFNIDKSYENYGLLRIYDNFQVGFYSLINETWIIAPVSSSEIYNYSISPDTYVGYFLTITKKIDNEFYFSCYDAYGNVIYKDSTIKYSLYIGKSNGKVYCSYYDSEQTIKKVYNEIGKLDNSIIYDQLGENFVNYIDEINYFGYEINNYNFSIYNSIVSVFDEDGKFKASYSLPKGIDSNPGFFVGTDYIYQFSNLLPDDVENYDVLINNNNKGVTSKYSLESYKLDYITGKIDKIKLNYCLYSSNGTPFKNESGTYAYSLVNAYLINTNNKTLSPLEEYLVDNNGKIILNASGFNPTSFIKMSNGNYYNTSTSILYDKKLNVISHLKSISPTYVSNVGFIGSINGKYGVVDESGKIIVPFKYESIDKHFSNDEFIVIRNNVVYKYNFKTKIESFICNKSNYINFGNGMYSIDVAENYEIISLSRIIHSSQYALNHIATITTEFSKHIIFRYTEYSNTEYYVTSLK